VQRRFGSGADLIALMLGESREHVNHQCGLSTARKSNRDSISLEMNATLRASRSSLAISGD
jgi:hypothetical protein